MGAIPVAPIASADCASAPVFHWITCFGVPATITSDRGLQFTSSLWAALCKMLSVSDRQTTAYHPEAKRCRRKTAPSPQSPFRALAAAATWADEIPWVLLGLRSQPREDTGLSLAEAVYCVPVVLPNEILQVKEFSVDHRYSCIFSA
jgi:hypothetical protein